MLNHKPCCHGPQQESCHSYLHTLVDAKFNFLKTITHATFDLVETVLHSTCHQIHHLCHDHQCHDHQCHDHQCHEHQHSGHSPYKHHHGHHHGNWDHCGQHACAIPQPCWMPTSLGEVHCEICESGRGTLTVWLTNEDYQAQTYKFSNKGDAIPGLTFTPQQITLQPKQRGKVVIVFDAPAQAKGTVASCYDLLIWIDSCRDYYLRWTLTTTSCPEPCCVEVCVEDVPDYELHWYDHFYAVKPCLGELT